jgi:hypothetical protein
MPTIQQMNEIIQPEIKRLFNDFYEDKYSQEVRENILMDLFEMIRNELIDEIYFCLFDPVEQKIIGGYSLKINSNQVTNLILPKNYELEKLKLSSTSEKFLILKLNEKETNDTMKIQSKLNDLTNNWDFLNQPEIKTKAEKKQLLWVDDVNVEIQEIKNE